MQNNNLAYALDYLQKGWSVIPVGPGSKVPLVEWEKYHTQLPTESEVREWFQKDANVGIVTGKVSNLTVVDIDSSEGFEIAKAKGIKSSLICRTGKGCHLYFSHTPDLGNKVRLFPGIDIRNDGGFVVAPYSSHISGGNYEWIRGYQEGCVTLPELPKVLAEPPVWVKQQDSGNWVSDLMKGVGAGGRHAATVKLAGYFSNKHPIDIAKAMMIEWNKKNNPPVEEGELLRTIEDVYARYKRQPDQSAFGVGPNIETRPINLITPANAMQGYLLRRAERLQRKGPEIATGFKRLDELTGGLRRQELFTVAARTGRGKTSFAIGLIPGLIRQGKRVLFFTTEMSHDAIYDRLLQRLSVEAKASGSCPEDMLASFGENFVISDETSPTTARAREIANLVKPDVLIFDHIQHVGGNADNQRAMVSLLVRGLKDIGRDLNCGIICISQLRRMFINPKTKEEQIPTLGDLKESGTIEEESAQVLLLSSINGELGMGKTLIRAELAKNRYGELATIPMEFDMIHSHYREIDYTL